MTFEEYLISKKISPETFFQKNREEFLQFKTEFEKMNPVTFDQKKKYLVNDLRRKYPPYSL